MGNFLLMLTNGGSVVANTICQDPGMKKIIAIVGLVIWIVRIGVPLILILTAVFDYTKAITSKDADSVQKQTKVVLNRAIAAIAVFLVPSIVSLLMSLIGGTAYKGCTTCFDSPYNETCGLKNIAL